MKIAILYHNDADGFGSAYAAWKHLKDENELMFKEVQYGDSFPSKEMNEFEAEKIYILDFSYPAEVLRRESSLAHITVIDHHKTSKSELEKVKDCIAYIHDETASGCVLTWCHFSDPEVEIPEILVYVQDRDLWKFECDHSREVNAYITTIPKDFNEWDNFYLPGAYDCGKAILEFQKKQIEGRMRDAEIITFEGYEVPIVNASENISEVGQALNLFYPNSLFSMTYCDRKDGKRSYSLRSNNGFDVSTVARLHGGGGHPGAAGFSVERKGHDF